MKKKIVAICYDFDKTLSVDYMQCFDFVKRLGLTGEEFWNLDHELEKGNDFDPSLSYLLVMVRECRKRGIKLSRELLNECGKNIKFYNGVETWFKRINSFAKQQGVEVEHYVISSGNLEIMEGTSIFKEFKKVFACEFVFDEHGEAFWPKRIVNYTLKTQFLFKINKGAIGVNSDQKVNERIDDKHVEFKDMIYIGDGFTDIPCMAVVKEKGGTSIGVYEPEHKTAVEKLMKDERINYACLADYSEKSYMEKIVQKVICRAAKRKEK